MPRGMVAPLATTAPAAFLSRQSSGLVASVTTVAVFGPSGRYPTWLTRTPGSAPGWSVSLAPLVRAALVARAATAIVTAAVAARRLRLRFTTLPGSRSGHNRHSEHLGIRAHVAPSIHRAMGKRRSSLFHDSRRGRAFVPPDRCHDSAPTPLNHRGQPSNAAIIHPGRKVRLRSSARCHENLGGPVSSHLHQPLPPVLTPGTRLPAAASTERPAAPVPHPFGDPSSRTGRACVIFAACQLRAPRAGAPFPRRDQPGAGG